MGIVSYDSTPIRVALYFLKRRDTIAHFFYLIRLNAAYHQHIPFSSAHNGALVLCRMRFGKWS